MAENQIEENVPCHAFLISIKLKSKRHHPLYGIKGDHELRTVGYIALPDPNPELMMEDDYRNAWFFRDESAAHVFDPKRINDIGKILSRIDCIGIDDIAAVRIIFQRRKDDTDESAHD